MEIKVHWKKGKRSTSMNYQIVDGLKAIVEKVAKIYE